MADKELFSIFGERSGPEPETVWKMYDKARAFNDAISLDDTVRTNENFFIGKQWEGVQSNGLPTPVFNILKRDVCFIVSTITSDNLKIQATPLAATPNTQELIEPARIFTEECEAIMERVGIIGLIREFARDAAVRGDGCLYTYWDADADTGTEAKGAICTEVVENTRVYFGNPNDRRVQSQPYIQIESREIVRELRCRAKENGGSDWENIVPDDDNTAPDPEKRTDDKATLLLTMWKNRETGTVWMYECTEKAEVKRAWDSGLKRYPIVWLNWDYVHDSYHGQAMITGLIPNQIFINKIWAMSMLSIMTTAYPKVVYDKTRIPKWTNRIGEAIGVNGGDITTAARIIDPASISPQIAQFIELAVEHTNQNLGATSVALGDTRPDNTSAIIALQRAAATPSELTKQNLHRCIEDLALTYLDFMGEYYGERTVDTETPTELEAVYQFIGAEIPGEIPTVFDFGVFKDMPMQMKLDVGASSYYSEIASIQTLDNLLMQNKITVVQYLERIPDGYIPDRRGLLNELKRQQSAMMGMPTGGGAPGGEIAETGAEPEIPTGGGYAALQRKINSGEA